MRGSTKGGLAALIGSGIACVSAQPSVQDENLLFAPPRSFKVGYQSSRDNLSMTEFVPQNESVEDWSEMLTVQVFRHAAVEAPTFLQGLGSRYMKDCPGTVVEKGRMFTGTSNGYVVAMLVLRCPNNPSTDKPETTIFRIIKGNDALYSVQHAWRLVPSDEQMAAAMKAMGNVIVCDTRTHEHLCPTFDKLTSGE